MESKKQTPKYTAEFRERGIRLYREQRPDYTSEFKQVRAAIKRSGDRLNAQNAAYRAIASKLGCSPDTLRAWCVQAARDAGERSGPSSEKKARIKELEREVKELRTANEILKKASAYFAQAELDRPFRK
jgi:transposase-like protein